MVDNKTLGRFISGINRGPLKNCKYIIDPRDEDDNAEKFENVLLVNNRIYRMVVDQAYLDMCRTLKNVSPEKKNDMLEAVTDELIGYFDKKAKGKTGFDEWHNKVVNAMKDAYSGLTVGQAQKIINMSFKYLYCFRSFRDKKKEHFTHCHMPLDAITLNWYENKTGEKVSKPWSKLDDKYDGIIEGIRKAVEKESKNKTMLEKDFEVWGKQKEKEDLNEIL